VLKVEGPSGVWSFPGTFSFLAYAYFQFGRTWLNLSALVEEILFEYWT